MEVYREAWQRFGHGNLAIINGLADTLIDLERLPEAQEVLDRADQLPMDDKNSAKREQVRRRLQQARAGAPVRHKQTQRPSEGEAGDLGALADITGDDLSQDAPLGRAVLLRRMNGEYLERAEAQIEALPDGIDRIIETGLWRARARGWSAAATWFDQTWERYAGDGVLRVHRNRAHVRAGEVVDWTLEQARYPYLAPVIETVTGGGKPPARLGHIDPEAEDLNEEQRQDAWFFSLAQAGDRALLDTAEEDLLAARHLLG